MLKSSNFLLQIKLQLKSYLSKPANIFKFAEFFNKYIPSFDFTIPAGTSPL
mgnify:CR=1 FL=1